MQAGGRQRPGAAGPSSRPNTSAAAGDAGDREGLKAQLVRMLQWDPFAAEGLVAAVEASQSQQEVEELVQGFTGGSIPAQQAVLRFWQAAGGASKAQAAAPAGTQLYRKEDAVVKAPAGGGGGGSQGGRAGAAGQGGSGSGSAARGGRRKAPSGGVELSAPSQALTAKDGSKVLDMGINIRTTIKKSKGGVGGKPKGGALTAASLERPVVNCLSCGKIFDCRAVTNDTIHFLESGGICTFCGNQVTSLRYADGSAVQPAASASSSTAAAGQQGQPASGAEAGAGAGPSTAAAAPEQGAQEKRQLSESEAAALELKNRLVEYDRNSAKRTTVIDDQSDFFEIDSNAWLNDEERAQLRQRQREIEEAEEARRRRVTVTFDLLGRKVLMANDAELAAAEPAAKAAAEAAVQAARATAEEMPQGGDTAAQAALERAEETLRALRISVNPSLAAANYVFLPTPPPAGDKPARGPPGAAGEGGATQAAGRQAAGSGSRRGGRKRAQRQEDDAPARLQHDDPFPLDLEVAVEVLAEDEESRALLEASIDEAQNSGPFDICPPTTAAVMKPLGAGKGGGGGGGAAAAGSAVPRIEVLQPGMVLLRGWLSLAQQAEIVGAVRVLGMGPGGFYQPSYSTGGQLSLKMMGLGMHWEPRTASYEQVRSSYDGATPPPIPPFLLDLVQQCMREAQAAPAVGSLPPIRPDIALVNFYEKQGRLGLHQDKDESPESLKAGIPVVSFSIGGAADFTYGPSRDEERCKVVRLESGDVLVFGGASRMLFHAVRAIHPDTAPSELLQRTNLRPGRLNITFRQR